MAALALPLLLERLYCKQKHVCVQTVLPYCLHVMITTQIFVRTSYRIIPQVCSLCTHTVPFTQCVVTGGAQRHEDPSNCQHRPPVENSSWAA